eukprot:TRINITY_DN11813_c0_g1_i1.p1 TRINITY_DN11813_c0_g1~~TRINITY_DN11813_c0_g1_i1.p1  ORF type:complete len:525 (+),score=120.68 TRINITY_DN11813_c0_g1_i1:55-1629(+)
MSEQLLFVGTFVLVALTTILLIAHYFIEHSNFKYLHVSTVAVVLGALAGVIVKATTDEQQVRDTMEFEVGIFFLLALPPIIFESAYSMKRGNFFANFGIISLLAWGGCIFSSMFTGIMIYVLGQAGAVHKMGATECVIFGSLISATDPVSVISVFQRLKVDRNLNAIVYGESVLNDAVAIVLVRTLEPYLGSETFGVGQFFAAVGMFFLIFGGSFVVGTFFAIACALVLKHTQLRDHPVLESAIFVLFAYLPYMLAEAIGTSGIVSMLFAGIVMAHYAANNLSPQAALLCKEFFAILATILEVFIFLYLGLSLTSVSHHFGVYLAIATIALMLLARAMHVVPLTALVNCFRSPNNKKLPPIPKSHTFVLWFAGLRGAIAFALAFSLKGSLSPSDYEAILSATLIIVMFTVIVFGNFVAPLLIHLGVKMNDTEVIRSPPAKKDQKFHFGSIDSTYLKPILTRVDVLERKRLEKERAMANGDMDGRGNDLALQSLTDDVAMGTGTSAAGSTPIVESDVHIEDVGTQ